MSDKPDTVALLARELFMYRTSANVPLPDDYWDRQSDAMKGPFLKEAAAIIATPAFSRLLAGEGEPSDELRRLSEAATPGPWEVFDDDRPGIDAVEGRNILYAGRFTDAFGGVGRKEDAALIVAAVNYVRARLTAHKEETP